MLVLRETTERPEAVQAGATRVVGTHTQRIVDETYRLLDDPAAWLIVPLMVQKALVGLVLVNRPQATPDLNYEDRDLLKTVGSHIAVHLAQEKSDNLLTEARQLGQRRV